jgi:hypothetical protein
MHDDDDPLGRQEPAQDLAEEAADQSQKLIQEAELKVRQMKMMTDGNLDNLDPENLEDDEPKSEEESIRVNSLHSTAQPSAVMSRKESRKGSDDEGQEGFLKEMTEEAAAEHAQATFDVIKLEKRFSTVASLEKQIKT